jgi:hypothetical protein
VLVSGRALLLPAGQASTDGNAPLTDPPPAAPRPTAATTVVRAAKVAVKVARSVAKGFVPADVAAARLAICQTCPNLAKGRCRLCGCFMAAKVRLAAESCPDAPPRWR